MKHINLKKVVHTPTVLQMEAVECGAASLAMILGYYKKYLPLEQLRGICGVSRDGSKASSLVKAGKQLGLNASGSRRGIDELHLIRFPAILFWNFNHFVVIDGVKRNKVYINDPAAGRKVLSLSEFAQSFTGIVLEFSPSDNFKTGGCKPGILAPIMRRIRGSEKILVYAVITGLFFIIPGLVVPAFSQFFVDKILINKMAGFFKPLVLAMILTACIKGVISFLQESCKLKFSTRIAVSSATVFFEHLFKLPVDFFMQRMPGEITSRILLNDSAAELVSKKLSMLIVNSFSLVFYGLLMFRYDVLLTILCAFSALINFVVLQLVSDMRSTANMRLQQESGKLYGLSMSGIGMIETLKASGTENDFFMQWSGQQSKVVGEQQRIAAVNHATSAVPVVINRLLSIGILAIGAVRIMNGDMTMGMLVAFQALMGNFTGPVSVLMEIGTELQAGKADLQRLDDVLSYAPAKHFLPDTTSVHSEKLQGHIQIKNISFGYSSMEPPLISGFNLELTPGSRVALVGGSGSGKSTIAKLIAKLYEPREGEILFDGKPSSQIDKHSFTSSVAMVDQDISMFSGTIKDNLTMWNTAIADDAYMQAAKDACIHDVIASRPGGYESVVGEGGGNFSGGQRQRLEIARALTGNPRILIMDEATSALDPVTEKQVDENIRRRGCTCIIVAHRLSTIRDCDEIIVLDKGKVVQRGTHSKLVDESGLYQTLIRTM